jgi:hypothetical protein
MNEEHAGESRERGSAAPGLPAPSWPAGLTFTVPSHRHRTRDYHLQVYAQEDEVELPALFMSRPAYLMRTSIKSAAPDVSRRTLGSGMRASL